jgi:hypothetical protein
MAAAIELGFRQIRISYEDDAMLSRTNNGSPWGLLFMMRLRDALTDALAGNPRLHRDLTRYAGVRPLLSVGYVSYQPWTASIVVEYDDRFVHSTTKAIQST